MTTAPAPVSHRGFWRHAARLRAPGAPIAAALYLGGATAMAISARDQFLRAAFPEAVATGGFALVGLILAALILLVGSRGALWAVCFGLAATFGGAQLLPLAPRASAVLIVCALVNCVLLWDGLAGRRR